MEKVEQNQPVVNTRIKDSVFRDMFGECEKAKENFLSLYNAITDSNLKFEETEIENVTLQNTIYMGQYNDVSMLINGKLVVLVEQQSTINENMPLRFLEYISEIYKTIIPQRKRYYYKTQPIPYPEFYVIYNGKEDYEAVSYLKLSDAFKLSNNGTEKDKKLTLELCVKVFNINKVQDTKLLLKCVPLTAYARLFKLIDESKDEFPVAVEKAINQLVSEGLMADYFDRNAREISNMLYGEYDREADMAARAEEAKEEQAIKTAEKMLKRGKLTYEEIADYTGLPVEKIEELAKKVTIPAQN